MSSDWPWKRTILSLAEVMSAALLKAAMLALEPSTGTRKVRLIISEIVGASFALVAEAGGTPQSLEVTADVSLGPDQAGGFRLTGIVLTVSGEVDGLDADGFARAAEAAKETCPVSKALTGVDISLQVSKD